MTFFANIKSLLSDFASKSKIDMVNIQNILFNFSLMEQNQNANKKFVFNSGLPSDGLSIPESNSAISPIYGMKSNNKFDTTKDLFNSPFSLFLNPNTKCFISLNLSNDKLNFTILNIYNMKSSNNLSPTMRSFNFRISLVRISLDGNKLSVTVTWKQIQSNTMLKLLPKDAIKTCQNLNSHINSKPMINLLNSKLLLQNINNNINNTLRSKILEKVAKKFTNINNNKKEGEPSKEEIKLLSKILEKVAKKFTNKNTQNNGIDNQIPVLDSNEQSLSEEK